MICSNTNITIVPLTIVIVQIAFRALNIWSNIQVHMFFSRCSRVCRILYNIAVQFPLHNLSI